MAVANACEMKRAGAPAACRWTWVCEAITGRVLASSAANAVASLACARSTIMPTRFIARTTADRTRVVSGTRVSVRVELGGRRIIHKKNTSTHAEQLLLNLNTIK